MFKGNQPLNNDLREMLFSKGCFLSGSGRRGMETIWLQSCVLVLGLNSSRERCESVCELMCVCMCGGERG